MAITLYRDFLSLIEATISKIMITGKNHLRIIANIYKGQVSY